jgi:hypothetical protein
MARQQWSYHPREVSNAFLFGGSVPCLLDGPVSCGGVPTDDVFVNTDGQHVFVDSDRPCGHPCDSCPLWLLLSLQLQSLVRLLDEWQSRGHDRKALLFANGQGVGAETWVCMLFADVEARLLA